MVNKSFPVPGAQAFKKLHLLLDTLWVFIKWRVSLELLYGNQDASGIMEELRMEGKLDPEKAEKVKAVASVLCPAPAFPPAPDRLRPDRPGTRTGGRRTARGLGGHGADLDRTDHRIPCHF